MQINNRLIELDSLRGIAILTVIFFHYLYRYHQIYGHSFEVSNLFRFTSYGVHLFFVISGFVIYWTISRCHTPIDFLWSRFSRLYPVYWVSLLLTYATIHIFELSGRDQDLTTLIANFFMIHEFFGFSHVDGVYWSLSIELAFYFWMLIIFSLGQAKHSERIFVVWVLSAILIEQEIVNFYVPYRVELFLLLNYIELFALGICFYHYKFKSYSLRTHILFISCIIALYFSYPIEIFIIFLSIISLFFLIVLNRAKFLRNRVLLYLGSISYALYLIHQNIGYVVIREMYEMNVSPLLGIIFAVATSMFLAHILTTCIERPSQKYLKSYYKKNRRMQQIGKRL